MQETEGRACVERPTGRTEPVGTGRGPGWPGSMVERSQAAHSRGNLGSLQLEVRLRDETVLPSGCYQPLVQLLCREVKLGTQVRGPLGEGGRVQGQHVCPPCPSKPTLKSKTLRCQGGEEPASAQGPSVPWESAPHPIHPHGPLRSEGLGFACASCSPASPCSLLQGPGQLIPLIEETTSTECRQDVASTLLRLFLGQGLAKDFLDLLFQLELGRTSEAWEEVTCGGLGGAGSQEPTTPGRLGGEKS